MKLFFFFFFFNDTATTEIYTLSLHDALPISFLNERYRLSVNSHYRDPGLTKPLRSISFRMSAKVSWLSLPPLNIDRKSTRLNSSHTVISYAVFCLKKKKKK